MSGELKPNSHQNIKMTLVCSKYPTHFEGEIQCQIEWETDDEPNNKHHDAKSVVTTTVANDIGEFLFIRLKKRSLIVTFYSLIFQYRPRRLWLWRTARPTPLSRTSS